MFVCILAMLASRLSTVRAYGQLEVGQSSPAMWRAWRPIVAAFGAGDAQSAIGYLREASAILRKADAKLARDEKTEQFRKRAIKSMKNFDLKSFLELLPYQEGEFRGFAFTGRPTVSAYDVRALDPASSAFAQATRRVPFGHSFGHVRLRKMEHESERRYLLNLSGGSGVGPLGWESVLSGLLEEGRLVENATGSDLPIALQAAAKFVGARNTALGERDRRLLASTWGSFPSVARMLLAISSVEDLVSETDPQTDVRRLQVVARWDLPGMKRRYPDFGQYWDALDNIADAHFKVSDASGATLIELDLNSERLEAKIRGYLKDGRLMVRAGGGFAPADFERMRVTADLYFVLHRIRLNIENLETDVTYRTTNEGAELHAATTRVPKISVSGAAFGILPTRVLDWFIPGDTESLARRLFEVAASGNRGRGAILDARFVEGQGGSHVELDYQVEVLDSALIRFCMAVIADASIPSDDEERDLMRFSLDYRKAFDTDLERFAKFGTQVLAETASVVP